MEKNKLNKVLLKVLKTLLIIAWPIFIIFLVHYIQYHDLETTISWMFNSCGLVLLEGIMMLGTAMIFTGIFKKYSVGYFVTSIVSLAISIISYLKYQIRGEVLLTTDVIFLKDIGQLAGFIDLKMVLDYKIILPILLTIILGVVQSKVVGKIEFDLKKRVVLALFPIIIVPFLFGSIFSQNNILPMFGLDLSTRYVPEVIYEKNGVILGIYANAIQNTIDEPENYDEKNVYSILSNLNIEQQELKEKPNVIVMMSESFFDPTVLPNVEYSVDPIPNIRKILEKYTSGNFVSSTFSGGTANIEFEVFTGNSINFLPYGICPFSAMAEIFERDIPTMQKDFKKNGYKTIAIHTYQQDFYSRNEIYPKLGFDEIIFQEDIKNPTYNGNYISDETFVDEIINKLEQSEEPVFVYGLSMQNHSPYSMAYQTTPSEIEIKSDFLSDVANDKLSAYVNGLYDTDKTVGRLVDYLEKSDRPTIFLFYGDHLPAVSEAYFESGFVSTDVSHEWDKDELYKMHSIPFFIYDNFGYKNEYLHTFEMGASLLGNHLLNYVGIEKSTYFNFLDSLTFRALRDRLFVDEEGNVYSKVLEEYLKEIEEYKILQYDNLFGDQYINQLEN